MTTCIVISREDKDDSHTVGFYKLATRTVFSSREAAEVYASTISASRDPIVIELPLGELRVGEERGDLGYWT